MRGSRDQNLYEKLVERVFDRRYRPGNREVPFERQDIAHAAKELGIALPKNLGDVLYSFRYRNALPKSIRDKAPKGLQWIIRPIGRSRYKFVAVKVSTIVPAKNLSETKVPNSTPGVVALYSLSDEQALLARLRYNRLVDIFTGVTCYSLQNHLRTAVRDMGQVETDEIYVGVDKSGTHYVLPVQAKGGSDSLSIVQIEQDIAMCAEKFAKLVCRPIGAQFMDQDLIALFEFETMKGEIRVSSEKHYRLVLPEDVTDEDLAAYRIRGQ
ncbi:MAG: endonuclease [candidate division Zixibacteria bacterium]|nr:endonuclease [candidate division Zixibacteria bacterium]